MYKRLEDIPVYEFRDGTVDARYFNRVQIALHRLGESIRFAIPKLKHLDLILEPHTWIIVDRVLNDIPVAAWTGFESGQRDNLHQPVRCRIQLYHANADMVLARTLEAMETLLGEQLSQLVPDDDLAGDSKVLPFKESSH
jgi:hypothetical protein